MGNENITDKWTDPDDAPPLAADYFEQAEMRKGDAVIRRGRPGSPIPSNPSRFAWIRT